MKYKGLARDIVSLGSIPIYLFFLISSFFVNTKVSIILIAALIFQTILSTTINHDKYLVRYILIVFSSFVINILELSMFLLIVLILFIISTYYLNKNKLNIIKGVIISFLTIIVAYFTTQLIFNLIGG